MAIDQGELRTGPRTALKREARAAIEGNPNYPRARQALAEILSVQGRFDEALAEIKRGLELDPLALYMNAAVVMTHYYARQFDAAIAQAQATIDMEPASIPRIFFWGWPISRPVAGPRQSGRLSARAHCPSGAR